MMPDLPWWKHIHWPEYGAELIGTMVLVFCGLSAVVLDFGKDSPVAALLPDTGLRLLLTGLLSAGSGSLVAISPLGKLSGAHINPAVSLAFWRQGKLHGYDLAGYVTGQLLGAILGVVLLSAVWGDRAASIHYGVTAPGTGYTVWAAFLAELVMTFLLVFAIFWFVSSHHLMRWTPLMTWLLVAALVRFGAPISGTSLNPARSLGPDLVDRFWKDQWIYCIAPPMGALVAVWAFRVLTPVQRDVMTGKLFHVPHYRSIFKQVSAPQMPTYGKLTTPKDSRRVGEAKPE